MHAPPSDFSFLPPADDTLVSGRGSPLRGTVTLSGDVGLSHRALVFAALAEGVTSIHGLHETSDVMQTARSVLALGAAVVPPDQPGGVWHVHGRGRAGIKTPRATMMAGNSLTAAALLMAAAGGHGLQATVTGDAALQRKSLGRFIKPLALMGVQFEAPSGDRLPLRVIGQFPLRAVDYVLPVNAATVVAGMLVAALCADGQTTLRGDGLASDMTAAALRGFGARLDITQEQDAQTCITLTGPQTLLGPGAFHVYADSVQATCLAAAVACVGGSDITVTTTAASLLETLTWQVLCKMGLGCEPGQVRRLGHAEVADVRLHSNRPLRACRLSSAETARLGDDLALIAAACALAEGESVLEGYDAIRIYDARFVDGVVSLLTACGVAVNRMDGNLVITGQPQGCMGAVQVTSGEDPRLAVAGLLLGMTSRMPIAVDGARLLRARLPGFVEALNRLSGGCVSTVSDTARTG